MNNNQALAAPLPDKLLHGIYQYLHTHNYIDTLETLQVETQIQYDCTVIDNTEEYLLQAISLYSEKQNSFKSTAVTQQQQYINTLKANILQHTQSAHPVSIENRTTQPHTANILAVRLIEYNNQLYYLSGSVDKTLVLYDTTQNTVTQRIQLLAPVLCIDYNTTTHLAVIGCMNGKSYIVDIHTDNVDNAILITNSDHTKYIVSCKISTDSQYYATASHDNTVKIYKLNSKQSQHCVTVQFVTAVESIEFYNHKLFVATRENNFIYSVDINQYSNTSQCTTVTYTQLDRYNMNSSGDLHVSFTALNLCLSPNQQLLAVATDRHRVIVFATNMTADNTVQHNTSNGSHTDLLNSNIGLQYCNIYDIVNDGYSTPRIAWSSDNRYLYVTTQHEYTVVGYDITTNQRVVTLSGHQGIVRDVSYITYQDKQILASCSYDRSVRLWTTER